MLTNGLARFRSVITAVWSLDAIVPGGHTSIVPLPFRQSTTVLGKLKMNLSGTSHFLYLEKYARRYLGCSCSRFNHRFSLAGWSKRIANAACSILLLTQRDLSVAEAYCYSSLIRHPSSISYRQVRWSSSASSPCPFFCSLVSLGSSSRIIRGEFLDFVHFTHRIHGALGLKPGIMGMALAELPCTRLRLQTLCHS